MELREALTRKGPGGVPLAVYALVLGAAVVLIARRRAKSSTSAGTGAAVSGQAPQQILPVILGTVSVVQSSTTSHAPGATPKKPTKKPAPHKVTKPKRAGKPKPKPATRRPLPKNASPAAIRHTPPARLPGHVVTASTMTRKGGASVRPAIVNAGHTTAPARTVTATHTARAGQSGTGSSLRLAVNT